MFAFSPLQIVRLPDVADFAGLGVDDPIFAFGGGWRSS